MISRYVIKTTALETVSIRKFLFLWSTYKPLLLIVATPCQSLSCSSSSPWIDNVFPASAMIYSSSLVVSVIMPRLAFRRRAPSCANVVKIGSLDDTLGVSAAHASGMSSDGCQYLMNEGLISFYRGSMISQDCTHRKSSRSRAVGVAVFPPQGIIFTSKGWHKGQIGGFRRAQSY